MSKIQLFNKSFVGMELPENSICMSDVPYNQNYHYGKYTDNLNESEYLTLLGHIPTPCVIIHYPEETINLLPRVYGRCEEVIAWIYNSNTGKQHRSISFWGCKPDYKRRSQYTSQPYKNPTDKRIAKRIAEGKANRLYDWWEMDEDDKCWNINQIKNVSLEKTGHPCQIPLEVMLRTIALTAQPGQTIVDPFLGSGTTGVAARMLGFDFIGYEIDEEYFKIAKERIEKT